MRRRLFRGFIARSKNFIKYLSSGLLASPRATAPFIWLRSPSHSEVSSIFLGSQPGRELLLGEGHFPAATLTRYFDEAGFSAGCNLAGEFQAVTLMAL